MNYNTNTPTYNTKNVNNFSDFVDSIDDEKEELKDVKRSINPNSDEQQHTKNTKLHYNSITQKMDDISLDEIDDTLDKLDESMIDDDVLIKLTKTEAYTKLVAEFKKASEDFIDAIGDDYDEGDTDQYMALEAALQEAFNDGVNI